jgi:hypothetical protein
MIRRLLDRLWAWACTRRDAMVTEALDPRRPGPIDRDLDRLLRESFE